MAGRKSNVVLMLALVALTLAIYSPVLKNGFVNYDDPVYITQNKLINEVSWKNTKQVFTSKTTDLYVPLVFLSFQIQDQLGGNTPFWYHLINLVLHILNCLLILWLIWLLSGNFNAAFLVAVLFAVHPLHVESVAWATERKDALYSFFFLLSMIAYWFYCQEKKIKFLFAVYLFFLFSCFSKPMAITLPVVLILYDVWMEKRWRWSMLMNKIPMLLISAGFMLAALKMLDTSHRGAFGKGYSFFDTVLTDCYGLYFYFYKAVFPVHLSVIYPYPDKSNSGLSFIYYLAPLMLGGIGWYIFRKKTDAAVKFCFLFFIITLLPVLQIIPNANTIAADRYFYIPSLGLFSILAFFIFKTHERKMSQNVPLTAIFIIVIVFSFQSYERCRTWKNSISLFENVIEQFQNSDVAYGNLGLAYNEKNDFQKAIPFLEKAVSLNQTNPEMINNYGWALSMTGHPEEAIGQFNKAFSLNPGDTRILNNLANTFGSLKKYDDAIRNFKIVISREPDNATVLYNLAYTFFISGDQQQAILYYRRSAQLGFGPAREFLSKNGLNW